MNNFKKFLTYCVPARILLIILSFILGNYYKDYKILGSVLAVLISAGFIFQDLQKKNVGAFGTEVYWNRVVHSILYFLFAICMYIFPEYAYILLIVDLLYGIFAVYNYYYMS